MRVRVEIFALSMEVRLEVQGLRLRGLGLALKSALEQAQQQVGTEMALVDLVHHQDLRVRVRFEVWSLQKLVMW